MYIVSHVLIVKLSILPKPKNSYGEDPIYILDDLDIWCLHPHLGTGQQPEQIPPIITVRTNTPDNY